MSWLEACLYKAGQSPRQRRTRGIVTMAVALGATLLVSVMVQQVLRAIPFGLGAENPADHAVSGAK
ncbi:MAG: hypothetical protein MO852_01705 [Candidatus Devosia euplotis]|nr:hypothetical protein [Candidatus Devosia euplotis]